MVCDMRLSRSQQTLSERKAEVRAAIETLSRLLVSNRVRAIVGAQGAIAFQGWAARDSAGVSDSCAYRLLMVAGSALAKQKIAAAEQLAGRSVNRAVINSGVHSHNGGASWDAGHKH